MTRIPFHKPDITELEISAVADAMRSGWLTSGPNVKAFEAEFAEAVGASHAIAVNSATTGALLILDAMGINEKAEVLVPAYTFSSPAMMAVKLGATVRLVDCAPGTYQIDWEHASGLVTRETRAVIATHFAGDSYDTAGMIAFKTEHPHVMIIDDAAHAFPTYTHIGTVGRDAFVDATFFSFYATKCLSTGDGGMVTTKHDWLARSIRSLAAHGFDRAIQDRYTNIKTGWKYDIAGSGWKGNMTDPAAAMGRVQLARSLGMRQLRLRIAQMYDEGLPNSIGRMPLQPGSAHHLYPVQLIHAKRDAFIAKMGELGVQCSVHFIPLHLHSFWKKHLGYKNAAADLRGMLDEAERMYLGEVSLPIYTGMTPDDVTFVIDCAARALKEI